MATRRKKEGAAKTPARRSASSARRSPGKLRLTMMTGDYEIVRALGAEVVAVSADTLESHETFALELGGVPFPLASDERLEAARQYQVLGDDGKRSRRAVFVIDRGGKILHAVPWFQPGNPTQYEEIFAALGFEV